LRIRIVRKPPAGYVEEGIDLAKLELNREYEVGSLIGSLLLAERWAEPVDERPQAVPRPRWGFDGTSTTRPLNLIREIVPSYFDCPPVLAEDRRRRPRPHRRG
jgi:hypothetical protein